MNAIWGRISTILLSLCWSIAVLSAVLVCFAVAEANKPKHRDHHEEIPTFYHYHHLDWNEQTMKATVETARNRFRS